jgi:protein Xni
VVVWDSSEPTWRQLLDDRYKANRDPTPPVLVKLIPELSQRFQGFGVPSLTIENYEADDVIATLAAGVASNHGEAVILSTDKMFYPLLDQGVRIYHQFDRHFVNVDAVQARFGLRIDQLVDYWALSGDNSNNIKGVPGVGKKTATDLLKSHGDLETLLQQPDIKKLADAADEARRCQQLVRLKQDVALGINLKDFRLH